MHFGRMEENDRSIFRVYGIIVEQVERRPRHCRKATYRLQCRFYTRATASEYMSDIKLTKLGI